MENKEVRNYQVMYVKELKALGKTNEEILQILEITPEVIQSIFDKLQLEEDKRKSDLILQMKRRGFSNKEIAKELGMPYDKFIKFQNKGVAKKTLDKKVRCIETGEVFSSIVDAQSKTGTRADSISHMINGRQKSAGRLNGTKLHWEFVK